MTYREELASAGVPVRRIAGIAVTAIALFFVLIIGTKSFEKVDANEILIVQDAVDGELHFYTTPGLKPQWFGRTIIFPKVINYTFEGPIRFNEGGHGKVVGSIQFRMPLDAENLTDIYTTYGNADALQNSLLSVTTDKSIFMTGPLLSSTESYAEKRSNLIFWIEDQIIHGVYRTTRRDLKIKDPITGEEKTATVAEIALTDGKPQRQETSQLENFGVIPFNFAVSDVNYDKTVEDQIAAQQRNAMAVQTAVAEARKAEQQALTTTQQGRALAEAARWEQEVLKVKAVTLAQQELEVARLDAAAADMERLANVRRGEGEASRRRALMNADNALEVKINAWLKSQELWANAIASYGGAWVPSVVMGSGTSQSGNGAMALMDFLGVKAARDLSLDLAAPQRERAAPRQK